MNDDLASVLVAFCIGLTVIALYMVLGWFKSHPKHHNWNRLEKKVRQIMATQAEIVTQLTEANATLAKIGTETDSLLVKIAELQSIIDGMADASPELVDAMAAVSAQIKSIDDKVPDAPEPAD